MGVAAGNFKSFKIHSSPCFTFKQVLNLPKTRVTYYCGARIPAALDAPMKSTHDLELILDLSLFWLLFRWSLLRPNLRVAHIRLPCQTQLTRWMSFLVFLYFNTHTLSLLFPRINVERAAALKDFPLITRGKTSYLWSNTNNLHWMCPNTWARPSREW